VRKDTIIFEKPCFRAHFQSLDIGHWTLVIGHWSLEFARF